MSNEAVLARVQEDISRQDLGKARDRLLTLVELNPDDLTLRVRLAEVYHRLQFPVMAGRYWYLEESSTPEMEAASAAFERSCNGDPVRVLGALQFRGDHERLPDGYARSALERLGEAIDGRYGVRLDPGIRVRSSRRTVMMLMQGRERLILQVGMPPRRVIVPEPRPVTPRLGAASSRPRPRTRWRGVTMIGLGSKHIIIPGCLPQLALLALTVIGAATIVGWVVGLLS